MEGIHVVIKTILSRRLDHSRQSRWRGFATDIKNLVSPRVFYRSELPEGYSEATADGHSYQYGFLGLGWGGGQLSVRHRTGVDAPRTLRCDFLFAS